MLSRLRRLLVWLCGRGDRARGQELLADVAELLEERRVRRGAVHAIGRASWDVVTLLTRPRQPAVTDDQVWRSLMARVIDETRQAWRSMIRRPIVSVTAVAMLALGMGLSVLTFTIIDGMLLRPLRFPRSEQLVSVYAEFRPESGYQFARFAMSWPELLDYQRETRAVDLAAYQPDIMNIATGSGDVERVSGVRTTSSAFAILGVAPALGGTLAAAHDEPGAPCGAVLSHEFWRDRFANASDIVGRRIRVGGQPCEVVGVMPPQFNYPDDRARVWLPLAIDRNPDSRGSHSTVAIGRMRDGVSFDDADRDRVAIMARWARDFPHHKGHGLLIAPLQRDVVGELRLPLLVLGAAVGLVLLVIAANVSNLLLAHGEGRRRELAVRQALGAGRARLVRQIGLEAMLIAATGGLAGIVLAAVSLRPVLASYPGPLPRVSEIVFDARVAATAMLLCLAVGLLVALIPAVRLTRDRMASGLRAGDRGGSAGLALRTQRGLVVTGLALSVAVTACALLLAQSFAHLQRTPLGFRPQGVVAMALNVPTGEARSDAQATAFFIGLLDRLRAQPSVASAGAISTVPLANAPPPDDFAIEGRPVPVPTQAGFNADYVMVTPGALETLGATLVQGRFVDSRDTAPDAPVAIINETLAHKYWVGEDPMGRRIRYAEAVRDGQFVDWGPWIAIVGIVGDMRTIRPADPPRAAIYVSHTQRPRPFYHGRNMGLLVRTSGDPASLHGVVRGAARELDGQSVVGQLRALDSLLGAAVARPRFMSGLMGVFAAVSLVVAALGVYGLIAYAVASRTREIGVRIALGASRQRIAGLVGRQVGLMLAAGLPIGLAGAAGLARWMDALLFGIQPFDPATYFGVAAILAIAVTVAVIVPARRAMRVDPLVALRAE